MKSYIKLFSFVALVTILSIFNFNARSIEQHDDVTLNILEAISAAHAEEEGCTTHTLTCSGLGLCEGTCGIHQVTLRSTGKNPSLCCPDD